MQLRLFLLAIPVLAGCGGCRGSVSADAHPAMLAASAEPTASAEALSPGADIPAGQPVEVEMRNVNLHMTDEIMLRVSHLRGRFVPAGGAPVPYLDDKRSYSVSLDSALIAIDMASLNTLLNAKLIGKEHSNIRKLSVSVDDKGRLEQKGVLKKLLKLPFKTKSTLEATPDGKIRVHTKSVKAGGLPVKWLMSLLGVEMDDMVKLKSAPGMAVDDNDFIMDPTLMLPAPRMRGRLAEAHIEGNWVVQRFGSASYDRLSPPAISRNYIHWRKGRLRFGRLTMDNTDLELIDLDPADPFDFSVDYWNDQLVAGWSKNTPDGALKTRMPDYDDLKAGRHLARMGGSEPRSAPTVARGGHSARMRPTAGKARSRAVWRPYRTSSTRKRR